MSSIYWNPLDFPKAESFREKHKHKLLYPYVLHYTAGKEREKREEMGQKNQKTD